MKKKIRISISPCAVLMLLYPKKFIGIPKQSTSGYFYTSDLGKTVHKLVFTNAYLDNWVILVS